jgi:hypothetical protein
MSSTKLRIVFIFLILFSLPFFPIWLTALLCVAFGIFFRNPYEIVVAGYVLDTLYGVPTHTFLIQHLFFILFFAIFVVSFWVREHLRIGL